MPNFTDSFGFTKSDGNSPSGVINKVVFAASVTMNFPVIAERRIKMSAVPLQANDTLEFIVIPERTFVAHVGYQILTPAGATCTFDIGDAAAATQFFSNADMNQAAGTIAQSAASAAKLYSTKTPLRITFDHAPAFTRVKFFVVGYSYKNLIDAAT